MKTREYDYKHLFQHTTLTIIGLPSTTKHFISKGHLISFDFQHWYWKICLIMQKCTSLIFVFNIRKLRLPNKITSLNNIP